MAATELLKTILKNSANLKAYYRFEAGALTTDSSANGKTLTNNNTVTETTGVFGGGMDTGNDATIRTLSLSDDCGVAGNSDMSFAFWAKLNSEISTDLLVFTKHASTSGANRYFQIYYDYNGGTRRVMFNSSGTAITKNVTLGTGWHHFAFTRNVVGNATVAYIDGAYVGNSTVGTGTDGTNSLYIGGQSDYSSHAIFDDYAIFSTVLSADQIKELYEGRNLGELRPQTGLIWGSHLNGNANDFSGNSNNGTSTSITYSQANGKFGQGAGFASASNSQILVNPFSSTGNSNLTCVAWIKTSTTTGQQTIIFSQDNANSQLYLEVYANKLRGNFWNGSTPTLFSSIKSVNDGIFHMIVFVKSGTTGTYYIDGSFDSSQTINNITVGNVLTIGRDSANNVNSFNGSIDEISVFNVAKSASWVRQQYSLGRFGEI